MAFTCGFFNSQNGDRKYNAEQMASIFDGLIKDGVYDTVGDIFAVTPGTGMQVLVGSGRAWFDHTWNNNDAQYPLAITAADVSLPRYDAVVLETNHSDTVRTNRLRVLTGTPASNPVKPTMTSTANVKQHPLAYIKVTAGAKSITQSMIQVVVGTSECPFVTGIIDTAQIDALFQQWNGEFNEWFDNLKAQLSDNVVANLQGQIDQKVAKADVATTADIEAGTSTTKWVTPKGLKEAGVESYQVGDIVATQRTDLGKDYLLCNGSYFDSPEYPSLAKRSALNPFDATRILFPTANGDNYFGSTRAICAYNGLWVAMGGRAAFYTTDPSSANNWTAVYSGINMTVTDISCYNGLWVAIGYTNMLTRIATTTDPTSPNWTINDIYGPYKCNKIYCHQGTWIAYSTSSLTFLYTSNPMGEWTVNNINGSSTETIMSICYGDHSWGILTRESKNSPYYTARLYTSNSISGPWTASIISNNQRESIFVLGYGNGTWACGGTKYNKSYQSWMPIIYYYQNSQWHIVVVHQNRDITSRGPMNTILQHDGKKWIFIIGPVYASLNISGPWNEGSNIEEKAFPYLDIQTGKMCCGYEQANTRISYYSAINASATTYLISFPGGSSSDKNIYDICESNNTCIAISNNNAYYISNKIGKAFKYGTVSIKCACIYCYNGLWVIGGFEGSSPSYPCVCVSNDAQQWTKVRVDNTDDIINDIYCYNGLWVAISSKSIYTSSNPATSWTKNDSAGGHRVHCYNGTWVAVNFNDSKIYVSTSPSGSWVSKNVLYRLSDIYCYNGLWVAPVDNYSIFMHSEDPFGEWKINTSMMNGYSDSADYYNGIRSITCYEGMWVAMGRTARSSGGLIIFTTDDPTGVWNMYRSSTSDVQSNCVRNIDGLWILGNAVGLTELRFRLPSISDDGYYSYIKAK